MNVASMAPSTLTSARPGISMFIVKHGAKVLICPCSTANGSSSVTEIGSSCTLRAGGGNRSSHNRPAWYCFRQENSWFAFTPCCRASDASDRVDDSVSSTIRRFSLTVQRRRGRDEPPPTSIPVSIQAPQWQHHHHQSSLTLQQRPNKAARKPRLRITRDRSIRTSTTRLAI